MPSPTQSRRLAALLPVLLLAAACSGAPASTSVEVVLQEFSVLPQPNTAPAGSITFAVTNEGPDLVHEFLIFRTDLEPGDLPVDENGVVIEDGEGVELLDVMEDLPVGESGEVTLELAAGNYVLVCNVYVADEDAAHYAMGMRTAFTVEGS